MLQIHTSIPQSIPELQRLYKEKMAGNADPEINHALWVLLSKLGNEYIDHAIATNGYNNRNKFTVMRDLFDDELQSHVLRLINPAVIAAAGYPNENAARLKSFLYRAFHNVFVSAVRKIKDEKRKPFNPDNPRLTAEYDVQGVTPVYNDPRRGELDDLEGWVYGDNPELPNRINALSDTRRRAVLLYQEAHELDKSPRILCEERGLVFNTVKKAFFDAKKELLSRAGIAR